MPNLLSEKISVYLGVDLVFNYRNYFVRSIDFDANDKKQFVGKAGGEVTVFYPIDVRLSIGSDLLVWNRDAKSILLQAFFGIYMKPYDVFSSPAIGGYLPFKKNTKGVVWDFGLRLVYGLEW